MQINNKYNVGDELFLVKVKNNNQLEIERVTIYAIKIYDNDYSYLLNYNDEVTENDLYDEAEIYNIFQKFIKDE